MRLSAKVQGATRKSAAKARASLAPIPAGITVGSRVLVRATQGEDPVPGVIHFIGETKFASGTWVGAELDEPKGKNDGTVQGVKYFTARSNHGIFIRPGKVEKIKEGGGSTQSNKAASNLVVGSRVLVRPAENCPGSIRFLGYTQFADGEWFGVELEKPLGKNDGKVKGVSYFSCPALHGIFARREHLLEAPSPETSPTTSPQSGVETEESSFAAAGSPKEEELKEEADASRKVNELKASSSYPATASPEVNELKAEVEQLRRELAKAKQVQAVAPGPHNWPQRISKQMKDDFEHEIQQFLDRRPVLVAPLPRRTGFGAFLQEQRRPTDEAFASTAAQAAQRWQAMEESERQGYGARARSRPRRKAKALMAGAFASAVYGQKAVAMEVVDENEEEEGGVLEQKTVEKPEQKPLKVDELEILSGLIEDYWASKELDRRTAPVFKFELEDLDREKCLSGDLHLMRPETEKVGHLAAGVRRFDGLVLKGSEELLILVGFNAETLTCRLVSERRSFSDHVEKEPSRTGYVTLSSLRFQRRMLDMELTGRLMDSDFFPPQVGDLHHFGASRERMYTVANVWEDEVTGRIHWTYGDSKADRKAPSTCCTRHGRLVVPFKQLPRPVIREMVKQETERPLATRKTPEGWCDLPKLWEAMDAGHDSLEVGCASAVLGELAAQTRKRRGGPRRALVLDPWEASSRRPKVKVRCTDQAFVCKAGSRFALLKENELGRHYIDRCGCAIELFKGRCKYKVRVDNSKEEVVMDARIGKVAQAIKLQALEYENGTELTVLLQNGHLVNGRVARKESWNKFGILIPDPKGEREELVELNEGNHVVGHHAEFDRERYQDYCCKQRDRFRFLEDSITCRAMDVETQVIYIDTAVENAKVHVADIKSLATLLLGVDGERFNGQQLIYRCLMIAGPGTGKTWSSCQLKYHLSKACAANERLSGIVKMPALVFAQKLAGMIRASGVSDANFSSLPIAAQNEILSRPWLEQAFELEYGKEFGAVLQRALKLRSAIVLLDGIDEASDVKGVLQSYIMRQLVPMEISLVLTSRPEGVSADLGTLKQSFAIMSLKPLSDEQQKEIILNQVQGNEFFENLLKFAEIRARHDQIYMNQAFADPKDRRYMEKQLPGVNRFKKEDGSWDPSMLQQTSKGVVRATEPGAKPCSDYFQSACGYFTAELLGVMDQFLEQKKTVQELETELKDRFPSKEFKSGVSLAKKLYELAEKREMKHEALWSKVISGTDELLSMAERFKPIFEKTVEVLCKHVQEEMKDLKGPDITYDLALGPLKDPVRITEKAEDDYKSRFKEFIPEANVVDVVRARLICSSGTQMKTFLAKIASGFQATIEGHTVKLSLARVKNKFSSKDSDPSRFRNVLLNLELRLNDEQSHFVELQVHHKDIYEFNEESHAHDLYDYFRREMASQYGSEMEASLNFMLEERMQLFKEISEVPVLLSVMTMALLHSNKMPSSLFELYDMGLQNILSSQLESADDQKKHEVWRLMQLVALHNQLNQKRIFMQKDVEMALQHDSELLPLWNGFVEASDVPFVKILADGEDAEYQFRHLSFQEALASQALAQEDALGLEAAERFKRLGGSFAEFLNIAFFRNMLRIGAGKVGDVFGRYWPLTSMLTDNGRAGLWNLLLGAKKLILVSFLRAAVDGPRPYEKAGFPAHSEDWFYTAFLFGKAKGAGSVMYSLSKVPSQVANLEAALVTNEACHILFRAQGLDLSAFEVPSISFPMHWDGAGRALDVSAAPARIGLQLSFNWKNSLLHFQESEVECLDPPMPKLQITDRAPEMHRLCGPRWIFVSQTPQEPYTFDPCACIKVIPVYIRGSNCTFLSGFGKSVSSDLKAGKPKPTGNIIAHQNQLLLASTYQAGYVWSALRATPEAPAAGKRRGEEHHRFHRSEALLAEDARAGRRGGVWGGGLELHYGRVDKVARAARRRQTLAMGFACVRAAFQMWRLSRGVKEGQPSAAEPTEAAEAAEGEESKPEVPEAPEPKASDQWSVSEAKYCEDTGGNAVIFTPRNAAKALFALKILWSREWKAQGARVSDFQRFLLEMQPPTLSETPAAACRAWLRHRGPRMDFSYEPIAVKPVRWAKDTKEVQAMAVDAWTAALRVAAPMSSTKAIWSSSFSAWKMLAADVVKDDVILPDQAPAIKCPNGHGLKLAKTSHNTCDRCGVSGKPEHYRCQKCDHDLCVECRENQMKAYWTAAVQHTWPLEKRLKAMKVAIRGRKPVSEEERARRTALLEGPTQRVYRIVKDGLGKCSACGVAKRKGYRSSERDFEHQLCRKCYMDWRKHLFKMRKAWDDELPPEGLALWNQMPTDVVKLDHPTKKQVAIAKRRQRKGKVWQELFGLRSFKQLLNLEFFTHRMEPEKAASFVTKHAELFRRAQMAQPMPEKREDVARCLAAKRRRWRKRSEDHPRTALKGLMPRAFFTHRLDEAASFLERFSKILTPVEEDPGQSPSDKG